MYDPLTQREPDEPTTFPVATKRAERGVWRVLRAGSAAILVAGLAGCSGRNVPAEKDPHYLRGMRLEQEGNHAEAIAAFERCLRRNPQCAKAHLQLGILYEDALGDTISAIYHYDRFLQRVTTGDDAEMVRRWRDRTEKAHYARLHDALEATLDTAPPAAAVPPQPSETDRLLVESVRQLQLEVQQLRQQLASVGAVAVVAAAPAAAAAPVRPTPAGAGPARVTIHGGERHYLVNSGDTLSEVSRRVYGTSRHWALLRDANHDVLKGSDRLKPGMRLRIPDLRQNEEPKG